MTDKLRAMLDERGIEHFDHENGEPLRDLSEAGADPATSWHMGDASVCAVPNKHGTFDLWIDNCTPEQAIAATVGADEDETDARDLTEAIRDDDGVRYSMGEVMDIMGKDVAAKVGNAQEPSNAVIERIERFCTDYAQCLIDSTILDMRNYEFVDLRAMEKAEVVEDKLIRELAEDIAKVGKDIEHYDGSGRRGTVAILQGGRKPEEVMFVHDDGGVTHYLPEDAWTCHMEVKDNLAESEGMGDVWLECDRCHWQMMLESTTPRFKYCPNCGRRIKED